MKWKKVRNGEIGIVSRGENCDLAKDDVGEEEEEAERDETGTSSADTYSYVNEARRYEMAGTRRQKCSGQRSESHEQTFLFPISYDFVPFSQTFTTTAPIRGTRDEANIRYEYMRKHALATKNHFSLVPFHLLRSQCHLFSLQHRAFRFRCCDCWLAFIFLFISTRSQISHSVQTSISSITSR